MLTEINTYGFYETERCILGTRISVLKCISIGTRVDVAALQYRVIVSEQQNPSLVFMYTYTRILF
jgi:hypothetical protein